MYIRFSSGALPLYQELPDGRAGTVGGVVDPLLALDETSADLLKSIL